MEWNKNNNKLTKKFKFEDFCKAVDFVNKILPLAEELDHHPDISIYKYNHVDVSIQTHEEDSITEKDYKLAKMIDKI